MDYQRYHSMSDAYRQMYLNEAKGEKPEGGKPGVPHYYPVPVFGRRPGAAVVKKTTVNVDIDTKPAMGPGEVDKAYYTYPAGFDPANREDVAKKDYDGSKQKNEDVDLDLMVDVCDYLIGEGFADGPDSAEAMYEHMSDEWMEVILEGMKEARKNVGASTCWDGYKAKGTKTKGGKEVPNCVKEGK